MNKETLEKMFDNKFPCYHHPSQCDGDCQQKYKDFIFQTVIPEVLRSVCTYDGGIGLTSPDEYIYELAKELYNIEL